RAPGQWPLDRPGRCGLRRRRAVARRPHRLALTAPDARRRRNCLKCCACRFETADGGKVRPAGGGRTPGMWGEVLMRAKRVVDILIGSALAVCALPMIVVLAIGCAISLRTWPFFVQWRVGKNGKLFRMPKLRTLPRSAPAAVDKYELGGVPMPRFCRILRRLHLDELPQLLMVPMGWMSLVGPRPEMPQLLDRYPSEFAAARLQVRPGCTGLWQVSESSTKLIYETPEYDL